MPGDVEHVETTTDALFGGAVVLRQPRRGYRVNVDALLLAAFAVETRTYRLAVRWYTELPDDGCFARWLLRPGG